ncbi:MAG: hypothetical protein KGM17_06810 [Sphingomonadales bacterium]|nr:hypothetical protein [Sphingomonadales bacterium]
MHGNLQVAESSVLPNAVPAAIDLRQAVVALGQALELIDANSAGHSNLSLAAAHAETALYLVEADLPPSARS